MLLDSSLVSLALFPLQPPLSLQNTFFEVGFRRYTQIGMSEEKTEGERNYLHAVYNMDAL